MPLTKQLSNTYRIISYHIIPSSSHRHHHLSLHVVNSGTRPVKNVFVQLLQVTIEAPMVSSSSMISPTPNPSPMLKLGSPKSIDTLPKESINCSSGINVIWRGRGRSGMLKPRNSLIVLVFPSLRHRPRMLQMSNKLS